MPKDLKYTENATYDIPNSAIRIVLDVFLLVSHPPLNAENMMLMAISTMSTAIITIVCFIIVILVITV